MRARLSAIPIALAVASATGCGGEGVNCDFTGQPVAIVGGGTSQTGFLSLSDGDDMVVTLGPQGLYMVTPSIRVQNMYGGKSGRIGDSADPEVVTELYLNANLVGGSAREHLGMTEGAGGSEALGIFSPFTIDLPDYLNQTVTIRGEVKDACGNEASDELDVRVVQ